MRGIECFDPKIFFKDEYPWALVKPYFSIMQTILLYIVRVKSVQSVVNKNKKVLIISEKDF